MKLYTRTGDDGSTGLFGGDRVPKHDPRVDAYGCVDELNAAIGLAAAAIKVDTSAPSDGLAATLRQIVGAIQSRLFDIGADLATPRDSKHADKVARLNDSAVTTIESWIDLVDAQNEPMKSFVLPGGSELAARLHVARTVCRRAERRMVALSETTDVTPQAIVFINRLSDFLFAAARAANVDAGVSDVPWIPESTD